MLTGSEKGVLFQGIATPLVAVVAFVMAGGGAALAAFFGCLAGVAASGVLLWRERRAKAHPEWDQRKLFGWFIRTAVERLLAVAAVIGLAFGVMKLAPLPLMLGLVVVQTGWAIAGFSANNHTKNKA